MPEIDISDLRPTIIPKSDQLNAEQLLTGPMTVTVTDVAVTQSAEQPVIVHYEGENGRPYKPCKTMRKVLILAWGEDARKWPGQSMTLYNDPAVRFGNAEVGGIRISHMSGIKGDIKVSLTATKGKKTLYEVKRLAERERIDHRAAMLAAPDLPSLKAAFAAAHKSTTSQEWRDAYKMVYDDRKAELTTSAENRSTHPEAR